MPLSPEGERQEQPQSSGELAVVPVRPRRGSDRASAVCWRGRVRRTGTELKASSQRAREEQERRLTPEEATGRSGRGNRIAGEQVVKGSGRPRSSRGGRSEPEEAQETAADTAEATRVRVAGRASVGARNCAEHGHDARARASARGTERDATLPKAGPERAGCECRRTLGSKELRHEVRNLVLQCAPLGEELLDPVSEKAGAILVVVGVGIAESFEREEERRSRGASGGGTPVPLAAPFTAEDASSRLRNPDIDCSFALPREHQAKLRAASARAVRHRLGSATDAARCDCRCPPASSSSAALRVGLTPLASSARRPRQPTPLSRSLPFGVGRPPRPPLRCFTASPAAPVRWARAAGRRLPQEEHTHGRPRRAHRDAHAAAGDGDPPGLTDQLCAIESQRAPRV